MIVDSSGFIDSNFGIVTELGSTPIVGIQVSNSNFANYIGNVYLQTEVDDLTLTGNQFYTPTSALTGSGGSSVYIAKVARFTATANNFTVFSAASNTIALNIADTQGWPGSVVSNTFGGQFATGISLGASTSLVTAYPNSYGTPASSGPTTPYSDSGTGNFVVAPVKFGGTGLALGTSGGIPYFNSTTSMASSAALANNAFVTGGGAGASPKSVAITGLVKGNGTSAPTAAVSGTDYAPPTSGSSILSGNGLGGFSNVTIGNGLSFSAGTLSVNQAFAFSFTSKIQFFSNTSGDDVEIGGGR